MSRVTWVVLPTDKSGTVDQVWDVLGTAKAPGAEKVAGNGHAKIGVASGVRLPRRVRAALDKHSKTPNRNDDTFGVVAACYDSKMTYAQALDVVNQRDDLRGRLEDRGEDDKDVRDCWAKIVDLRQAAAQDEDDDQEPTELPAVPEYPAGALTGPLRDLIGSSPLPAALVAGAGLAALAGLCPDAELQVRGDPVPPILWVAAIAPVSGGKTPALALAFREFKTCDAVTHAQYRLELAAWRAVPVKERDRKPPDRTRIIEDVTGGKLARQLDDEPGRVAVHDELAAGIRNIGQYKRQSGDRDQYLKLWSGQPWRYSRVGDDIDILIPRPVMSVVGGLQTDRLHILGEDADGFRARWLPHLSEAANITWEDPLREPVTWETAVRKMYDIRRRRGWTLGGTALRAWADAGRRWKAEAQTDDKTMVRIALGKADQ